MTAEQKAKLQAHAQQLLADPKWVKAAIPDAIRWARMWAAYKPQIAPARVGAEA